LKVLFEDEIRFGLIPNYRRNWSRVGQRSIVPYALKRDNSFLWAAIDVISGQIEALVLPFANTEMTNLFLEHISWVNRDYFVFMVWDRAGWHRAEGMDVPHNVRVIELPSYSPELNPVERFNQELRKHIANRIFETLEDLEDEIIKVVRNYVKNRDNLKRLCGFEWIRVQLRDYIHLEKFS
jgi:transposase